LSVQQHNSKQGTQIYLLQIRDSIRLDNKYYNMMRKK